jgi:hypothetical protein
MGPEAQGIRHRRRGVGLGERPATRHRDPGGLGDLATERLAGLDPRCRAGRAEHREPSGRERVDHARRERRFGADHDQLHRMGTRNRGNRCRVERVDARRDRHPRLARDPVVAGRDDHIVDARLVGELPGQRMFPTTTADDEDPRRHDRRGHAGCTPAVAGGRATPRRSGRAARSIV